MSVAFLVLACRNKIRLIVSLGATIVRPNNSAVMTALGAAVAAAIAANLCPKGLLSIREHEEGDKESNKYNPQIDDMTRKLWMRGWKSAVDRSLGWSETKP